MTDHLRVSVGALCRIESHGKLLLGVNKNRMRAGREMLTPLGGALAITAPAARDELVAMGVVWEQPATWEASGHLDLRLSLPTDRFGEFESWLDRFDDGDSNAMRELREELVEEYRALDSETFDSVIRPGAVRWRSRVVSTGVTGRAGMESVPTRRYGLVYDVDCPEALETALQPACIFPAPLEWVTATEIAEGRSLSGREIGANARDLLS